MYINAYDCSCCFGNRFIAVVNCVYPWVSLHILQCFLYGLIAHGSYGCCKHFIITMCIHNEPSFSLVYKVCHQSANSSKGPIRIVYKIAPPVDLNKHYLT